MSKPIDVHKIAQLVDQHQAALRLYASQFTRWSDDCVQEAFIDLAERSTLPDSPKAWLYRAVRSRSLNRKRSEQRREEREAVVAQSDSNTKNGRTDDSRLDLQWVASLLEQLEPDQRELVVLRIWSQLGWKQIAELTQQSTSNAHRRYLVALKTLKQMSEQQYE